MTRSILIAAALLGAHSLSACGGTQGSGVSRPESDNASVALTVDGANSVVEDTAKADLRIFAPAESGTVASTRYSLDVHHDVAGDQVSAVSIAAQFPSDSTDYPATIELEGDNLVLLTIKGVSHQSTSGSLSVENDGTRVKGNFIAQFPQLGEVRGEFRAAAARSCWKQAGAENSEGGASATVSDGTTPWVTDEEWSTAFCKELKTRLQ